MELLKREEYLICFLRHLKSLIVGFNFTVKLKSQFNKCMNETVSNFNWFVFEIARRLLNFPGKTESSKSCEHECHLNKIILALLRERRYADDYRSKSNNKIAFYV
jgi:hypothetical protein